MKRSLFVLLLLLVPVFASAAATPAISRRDGFVLMWKSIGRPAGTVKRAVFSDLPAGSSGFQEITYAENRGLIDEADTFSPDAPLQLQDALVWLFRTRNVANPDEIEPQTLSGWLLKYPIANLGSGSVNATSTVTQDQEMTLMRLLDNDLMTEVHEVSLYSEKFNGKGTAFGESFDMNAMTAAHRTYPYNTLVKVTNVDNGKSVVVRINDRGPYVEGRDMDLSLGAFTTIADRSKGVIHATFERLGDVSVVGQCTGATTYQQRLTKNAILTPGVPHQLSLGNDLTISSTSAFVVRSVTYPDGTTTQLENWILPGETYEMKPSVPGQYSFHIGSKDGRSHVMDMTVVQCGS